MISKKRNGLRKVSVAALIAMSAAGGAVVGMQTSRANGEIATTPTDGSSAPTSANPKKDDHGIPRFRGVEPNYASFAFTVYTHGIGDQQSQFQVTLNKDGAPFELKIGDSLPLTIESDGVSDYGTWRSVGTKQWMRAPHDESRVLALRAVRPLVFDDVMTDDVRRAAHPNSKNVGGVADTPYDYLLDPGPEANALGHSLDALAALGYIDSFGAVGRVSIWADDQGIVSQVSYVSQDGSNFLAIEFNSQSSAAFVPPYPAVFKDVATFDGLE